MNDDLHAHTEIETLQWMEGCLDELLDSITRVQQETHELFHQVQSRLISMSVHHRGEGE